MSPCKISARSNPIKESRFCVYAPSMSRKSDERPVLPPLTPCRPLPQRAPEKRKAELAAGQFQSWVKAKEDLVKEDRSQVRPRCSPAVRMRRSKSVLDR